MVDFRGSSFDSEGERKQPTETCSQLGSETTHIPPGSISSTRIHIDLASIAKAYFLSSTELSLKEVTLNKVHAFSDLRELTERTSSPINNSKNSVI